VLPLSEAVKRASVSSKLVVSAVDPGSSGIRSVGKPSAIAVEVEVVEGVAVLSADSEAPAEADGPDEDAEPLADGETAAEEDTGAEGAEVPVSVVSESEVQPAAARRTAAAVRAIGSFFMGIRICWEVRIWSPV